MEDIKEKLKKHLSCNKYMVQSTVSNSTTFYKSPIIIILNDDKFEIKDLQNNRKFLFEYDNLPLLKKFIKYIEKEIVIS